jgi:hypothetical protein
MTSNIDRDTRTPLRPVRLLVAGYLGISVLTLVAVVLLRNDAAVVNAAVWIRTTIVVASAAVMAALVARAARGSRRAYLRVRILSAVMVVAITVIIALPDPFPVWLKIEQGLCGLVLLGVVVVANGRRLRSAFAKS